MRDWGCNRIRRFGKKIPIWFDCLSCSLFYAKLFISYHVFTVLTGRVTVLRNQRCSCKHLDVYNSFIALSQPVITTVSATPYTVFCEKQCGRGVSTACHIWLSVIIAVISVWCTADHHQSRILWRTSVRTQRSSHLHHALCALWTDDESDNNSLPPEARRNDYQDVVISCSHHSMAQQRSMARNTQTNTEQYLFDIGFECLKRTSKIEFCITMLNFVLK